MKNSKTPIPVTYVIDFDPDKSSVTLTCDLGRPDTPEHHVSHQVFNLDVLPMSMVMTNICQLLMPTK